ncbi:MAG TPA: hypothetical protein PKD34_03670, partial [Candidatus Doudnabacteria bacterium]|nr:hypothetical protein [Candidatus Doudnabacteria bacterium]
MITIADIINYIEEKSNIIIVDSYKDFLMQFLKLIKPVEFECLLNDKIQLLCLDNLYNVIDLSQMIALRSSYPELIENQLV